jgi:hypothetical protein
MKTFKSFWPLLIGCLLCSGISIGQQSPKLGKNAALRYWAAFGQMQDSTISEQEAKELNGILEGTVPYDDTKYKTLVEKNRPALETMQAGTAIPSCDWGLNYRRGPEEPVDYARKALTLGRLNVLYSFHLLIAGDKDAAVHALAAGLRFSHDVANGGTLFATLIAKDLLTTHFRAIEFALHVGQLSPGQKLDLQKTVDESKQVQLDWGTAIKRELAILRPEQRATLDRLAQTYAAALDEPSEVPQLEQLITNLPEPLRGHIPNPKRVIEEKQDLSTKLQQVRAMF